jgi:hypothetical protein
MIVLFGRRDTRSKTSYASPVPRTAFEAKAQEPPMNPQILQRLQIWRSVPLATEWHSGFGPGTRGVAQNRNAEHRPGSKEFL